MRGLGWVLVFVVACGWLGCQGRPDRPVEPAFGKDLTQLRLGTTYTGMGPIQIVCTTGMVADVVRAVGGPRVQVSALMGPGVDPHLYQPTTEDILRLSQAQMIFFNGLHLEGKMGTQLEKLQQRKPVIALAEYLPAERLLKTGPTTADPHVWFDVSLWRETVTVAATALKQFDPTHADEYEMRAAAYRDELQQLHEEILQQIQNIPAAQRILITAHDAFGYFGKAYGVEVHGIQGISTESEAGVHRINELVQLLVQRKVNAVFIESSLSDQNIIALVEGARAAGHEVKQGGELYSDAMGPADTPAATYTGMVRHNIATLTKALR